MKRIYSPYVIYNIGTKHERIMILVLLECVLILSIGEPF